MNSKSSRTQLLIVVDSNSEIKQEIEAILEKHRFEYIKTSSIESCLQILNDTYIDGIISQYNLKDKNGITLLKRIRESYPILPFILYTDSGSEKIAMKAISNGVDRYIPKNQGPKKLVETLEETIYNSPKNREKGKNGENNIQSRQRYMNLIRTSPAPINLFDSSGKTLYGNDAVLDLLGLDSRSQLVGRSIFDFIHPKDHELAKQELKTVVEEKRSTGPTEMKLERDDGKIKRIRVSTAPGKYQDKDIGQAVIIDITELIDIQEKYKQEKIFIQNSLDSLQDIFYFIDTDKEIIQWNKTAEDITGYTKSEIEDLEVYGFIAREDREKIRNSINKALKKGEDTVEAKILTKNGEVIPYEFRKRSFEDENGEILGLVGIGRDISEQKRYIRQLETMDRILRHNLRNNLNAIVLNAEQIQNKEISLEEVTKKIVDQSNELLEISEKERDIIHALSGKQETQTIDIVSEIEKIIEDIKDQYSTEVVHDPPENAFVYGVTGLKKAFFEVIENAIIHNSSDTPKVEINIEKSRDTVYLSIKDDGPKIPDTEIDIRSESQEIDQLNHSLGIGLWLVKWMVETSNGSISFEYTGNGNLINITLPKANSKTEK